MSPLYVIASCPGKLFIVIVPTVIGFVASARLYFRDRREVREHTERMAAYRWQENTKEAEGPTGWPTKLSIEAQAGALYKRPSRTCGAELTIESRVEERPCLSEDEVIGEDC